MTTPYNKDLLFAFINETLYQKKQSTKAAAAARQAAAWALFDALRGEDLRKQLGLKRKKKPRRKITDPDDLCSLKDPKLIVVCRYVAGELDRRGTIEKLKTLGLPASSERTLERVIAALKPLAEDMVAFGLLQKSAAK